MGYGMATNPSHLDTFEASIRGVARRHGCRTLLKEWEELRKWIMDAIGEDKYELLLLCRGLLYANRPNSGGLIDVTAGSSPKEGE